MVNVSATQSMSNSKRMAICGSIFMGGGVYEYRQQQYYNTVNTNRSIIYGIIGVQGLICAAFNYSFAIRSRLYLLLERHFTASGVALRKGRIHVLLTSVLAHQSWIHLIINSFLGVREFAFFVAVFT